MRIVVHGQQAFGKAVLEALLKRGDEVVAVYVAPEKPGQKEKIIDHLMLMAREVGFLHDGDPYKMRPRLEEILNHLPNSIEDAKTLHGLIDQIVRSVKKGEVDLKGRYGKGKARN